MNIRIKYYLQQMSKYISNKAAKQNAIIEIENHLLDQVDFYIEKGYSEDEAVDLAIKEATNPKELGEKLNIAHKPMFLRYPALLYSAVCLSTVILLLIITAHYSLSRLNNHYIQLEMQEKENNIFQKFEADLNILAKKNLIIPSRKKNIDSFLLKHFDFYTVSSFDFDEIDKSSIDLKFIDKTLDYDHWNIFHRLQDDPLVKNKNLDFFELKDKYYSVTHPHYHTLLDLTVKRAEQLIRLKKYEMAEALMDKNFQLLISTHNLFGGSASVNSLKEKNNLIKKYHLESWKKIDPELIKVYHRVVWNWVGFFRDVLERKGYMEKLEGRFKVGTGSCIGLTEGILTYNFIQSVFQHNSFFSPRYLVSLEDQRSLFENLIKECGMPELGHLTYNNSMVGTAFDKKLLSTKNILFKIPLVKDIYTSYVLATTPTQFKSMYLKKNEEKFY